MQQHQGRFELTLAVMILSQIGLPQTFNALAIDGFELLADDPDILHHPPQFTP